MNRALGDIFIIIMIIMQINCNRKATKYIALRTDLHSTDSNVKFLNLSICAVGFLGSSSDSLLSMFKDFNLDENTQNYFRKKVISIFIRCTYHVLCRGNKKWPIPELLDF